MDIFLNGSFIYEIRERERKNFLAVSKKNVFFSKFSVFMQILSLATVQAPVPSNEIRGLEIY